ncbi:MAG: hypothetical protein V1827_06370 [Candidatus Micrarchaeota archaeon]
MRPLRKSEEPRDSTGCREPARKRFGRWFAAPVLAAGMALSGGCEIPHTAEHSSTGSNHTLPQCETIRNSRTVNRISVQEQERIYCEGILSVEVSTFAPSLNNGLTRQSVWVGDRKVSLLSSSPPSAQNPDLFPGIVQMIPEGTDHSLSPGSSISVFDGAHSLRLDEIDSHGAYITINPGTSPIVEHFLLRFDYLWYFFPLGDGTVLVADLYGTWRTDNPQKSLAYISVFRALASENGLGMVGSSELNDETAFFMANKSRFTTADGVFDVDAAWVGTRLAGWTLSRADGDDR